MRKNDDLISRQDALSFLRNWERVKDYSWGERNIIKATINEIESLPSAQPEKRTEERTETHACDLIDRQAAQTELMMKCERYTLARESHGMGHVEWSSDLISVADAMDAIRDLPSAQPEPHYCRECKWSRCHINVDKYGNTETYWHCRNWGGGTDEEGYCYEWERKDEGSD